MADPAEEGDCQGARRAPAAGACEHHEGEIVIGAEDRMHEGDPGRGEKKIVGETVEDHHESVLVSRPSASPAPAVLWRAGWRDPGTDGEKAGSRLRPAALSRPPRNPLRDRVVQTPFTEKPARCR